MNELTYDDKNNLLRDQCSWIMGEVKNASEWPNSIKSREVILSANDFDARNSAFEVRNFMCDAIHEIKKNTALKIELKELRWHNVMDSCNNITGDRGFFYLTFELKI